MTTKKETTHVHCQTCTGIYNKHVLSVDDWLTAVLRLLVESFCAPVTFSQRFFYDDWPRDIWVQGQTIIEYVSGCVTSIGSYACDVIYGIAESVERFTKMSTADMLLFLRYGIAVAMAISCLKWLSKTGMHIIYIVTSVNIFTSLLYQHKHHHVNGNSFKYSLITNIHIQIAIFEC